MVACLGMACGAGRWRPALVGFGITLALLAWGGPFEQAVHRRLRPGAADPPSEAP